MHQNLSFWAQKSKNNLGRGTANTPHPSTGGEGTPPPYTAPLSAPRSSRSPWFVPLLFKPWIRPWLQLRVLVPCGVQDTRNLARLQLSICRHTENTWQNILTSCSQRNIHLNTQWATSKTSLLAISRTAEDKQIQYNDEDVSGQPPHHLGVKGYIHPLTIPPIQSDFYNIRRTSVLSRWSNCMELSTVRHSSQIRN